MKTHLLTSMVLLVGSLLIPTTSATANPLLLANHGCDHVIDLLLQYGNGCRQKTLALPHADGVLLGDSIGDLELMSVTMLDVGSDVKGPTIAVTLRNNSVRDVHRFAVSAVAVLGRINPLSPSTTQRVKCVAAGESIELHLCLPLEALSMGRAGTDVLAFRKLVVAIDSFDELFETDEANNLLIIDRLSIPVAAPAAAPVVSDEATPEATSPAEVVPPTVQPSRPENKLEDLDFDNLEIRK